ncbi:hypothetical protein L0Y46_04505 [bacterium]|nr:hypothetical protein [bacterium]MCI0680187.1 hypothetical protein [bacterium]
MNARHFALVTFFLLTFTASATEIGRADSGSAVYIVTEGSPSDVNGFGYVSGETRTETHGPNSNASAGGTYEGAFGGPGALYGRSASRAASRYDRAHGLSAATLFGHGARGALGEISGHTVAEAWRNCPPRSATGSSGFFGQGLGTHTLDMIGVSGTRALVR